MSQSGEGRREEQRSKKRVSKEGDFSGLVRGLVLRGINIVQLEREHREVLI